jgi:hypothetical protein
MRWIRATVFGNRAAGSEHDRPAHRWERARKRRSLNRPLSNLLSGRKPSCAVYNVFRAITAGVMGMLYRSVSNLRFLILSAG